MHVGCSYWIMHWSEWDYTKRRVVIWGTVGHQLSTSSNVLSRKWRVAGMSVPCHSTSAYWMNKRFSMLFSPLVTSLRSDSCCHSLTISRVVGSHSPTPVWVPSLWTCGLSHCLVSEVSEGCSSSRGESGEMYGTETQSRHRL